MTRIERLLLTLSAASAIAAGSSAVADDPFIDLGRGPVTIWEPEGYDPDVPAPLVMLLHGFGGKGIWQEGWMKFKSLQDEFGYFYLHPDGTIDQDGYRFWNATHACCDLYGTGVDDSGYLRSLIDEMKSLYNIDERRVYLIGHSNGGFMCYRMACDHADAIAAIASLAGAMYYDPADCTPSEPVHVLQMHGTADAGLLYDGGFLDDMPYPSAVETVEYWAAYDGCDLTTEILPPLDLDSSISGEETTVSRYASGCNPGGSAELWSIVGGDHTPVLTVAFRRHVIEYLMAHPKPLDCPADISGDEVVDVIDLLSILAAWEQTGAPGWIAEDLSSDGVVDVVDLLALLGAWGPCS